jgi:GNAT superfamily N-acetyltransferase
MRIEHLNQFQVLDRFDCGNKAMNDWLVRYARENEQLDLSRTYLLIADTTEVIGYYTLTGMSTSRAEVPRLLRRGTPNLHQPGCLLARLAVSLDHQGQGHGRDLMVDAVKEALAASQHIALRFIAVDPLDDRARAIYERWGFHEIPGDRRMFLGLAEAAASFDP